LELVFVGVDVAAAVVVVDALLLLPTAGMITFLFSLFFLALAYVLRTLTVGPVVDSARNVLLAIF
jgi:hypothetical protein